MMELSFKNMIECLQFSPADFFGVKYGLKPVSRIDVGRMQQVSLLNALCQKEGIKLKIIETKIYDSKDNFTLAYISKSEKLIEEAARAEREGNRLKVAELFGYPECCAKFFIKNLNSKTKGENGHLIIDIYKNSSKPFSYYLNSIYNTSGKGNSKIICSETFFQRLGSFCLYYIPHHACSFNCKKSIAFGKEMEKIFRDELPEFNAFLKHILKKPVLVFDDMLFCAFNGLMRGNKVEYETIIPELSFLDAKIKKIILEGDEIIKEKSGFYVYKNGMFVGSFKDAILLQFE